MDNERDSLCAFHLRIATFDSGCANATAEQEAPPTKDGGIDPKGWCAVRTLHIAIAVIIHSFDRTGLVINKEKGRCKEKGWGISIALLIQSLDRSAHPTRTIAFAIRSVDRTRLSQSLFIPLIG